MSRSTPFPHFSARIGMLLAGAAVVVPDALDAAARRTNTPGVERPLVQTPQREGPGVPSPGVIRGDEAPAEQPADKIIPRPGEVIKPIKLSFPAACRVGENCWLVNFVDHAVGRGVRDFKCGAHGYDGHKGTDIALKNYRAMEDGVPVLAAAPGKVIGLRDGVIDGDIAQAGLQATGGRDCGNGVTLKHEGDWRTSYCHLKRNSLVVSLGQEIERGQKIAEIGSSGAAQFPHLHLEVRFRGKTVIDPFVGLKREARCGRGLSPLWDRVALAQADVDPTALYDAGFARLKPNPQALRQGYYRDKVFTVKAPNIIFWMDSFWVKEGDRLTLTITAPDGEVMVRDQIKISKDQARYMAFVGKRLGVDWRPGGYVGEAVLKRMDEARADKEYKITRTLRVVAR